MSDAAHEALAHAHINSLLARYYQSIDVADWQALREQVLHPDAVWSVTQASTKGAITQVMQGREAVLEWFSTMMGGDVSMSDENGVRHFVSTTSITVDGSAAHSRSHLMCVHIGSLAVLANGSISADHIETEDGWRIRHFTLRENITDGDMEAFRAAFDLEFDA